MLGATTNKHDELLFCVLHIVKRTAFIIGRLEGQILTNISKLVGARWLLKHNEDRVRR